MNLNVQKTLHISGQVIMPSSKSQSIRALFFALLAKGTSILINVLNSDDIQDAINICRNLGAIITVNNDKIIVESSGLPLKPSTKHLYSGNSGITTRFVIPLLGLRQNAHEPIILDCGTQMRARPIKPLIEALKNLGLSIQFLETENTCPLLISGNLAGNTTEIDALASQYLSALLIALPFAPNNSVVRVKALHARPYVEMTLHWLKEQHINYSVHSEGDIEIYNIPSKQTYKSFTKHISGDFSSASYFIAAATLLPGCVELDGLDMQEPQGDKRLVSILQAMGADIVIDTNRLIIRGGNPLIGIKIDAIDIPDLLPTLAVIGTQAAGKTEIYNVSQARNKETDRIHSMSEGLTRMGAKLTEHADGMTIYPSNLQGIAVKGYGDHRTVMALALAGMLANGQTIINDAESINKTFPEFIALMQRLGAKMELDNLT